MRRITAQDMREIYGEVPDRVNYAVQTRLRNLPEGKRPAAKGALRRGFVLVLALMLLGGAAVAANGWMDVSTWLGVESAMQTSVVGTVIGEGEEAIFTVTQAARYGGMVVVGVHVQPTQEGRMVLPVLTALMPLRSKGADATLMTLKMSNLGISGLTAEQRWMTVSDYLSADGRIPVWTSLTMLPVAVAQGWNAEAGMNENGAIYHFFVPQEDGSAMYFMVMTDGAAMPETLRLNVRFGSIDGEEMTATFADKPTYDAVKDREQRVKIEVTLPDETDAPHSSAEPVTVTDKGGRRVTVADAAVYPMPFGYCVSYRVEAEGFEHIDSASLKYDGEDEEGVMNIVGAYPWYDGENGVKYTHETHMLHGVTQMPETIRLIFSGDGSSYQVKLHLTEAE